MLAFTSVREDVPVEEVTRDLERLSHEAQAADQPGARRRRAEGAGRVQQGARSDRSRQRARRAVAKRSSISSRRRPSRPASRRSARRCRSRRWRRSRWSRTSSTTTRCARSSSRKRARSSSRRAPRAPSCTSTPGDIELLTTLRRAFHTLKGSSRMVGLKSFGEAAWSCEQVFNTQLAEQRAAEPPLIEFAAMGAGLSRRVGRGHRRASLGPAQRARGPGRRRQAGRRRQRRAGVRHRLADRHAGRPAEPRRSRPERARSRPQRSPRPSPRTCRSSSTCPTSIAWSSPDRRRARRRCSQPTVADASAMFDRFDDARSDALQTTLTNAQFDQVPSGRVDLDLGSPADAPGMIQKLAPSEGTRAGDDVAGLTLDLSTGEAVVHRHAGRFRLVEPGRPRGRPRPPRASRRATSTSRSSARCGSASRSSTSTSTRPTSCRAAS